MSRSQLIIVAGNIATGKTTFARQLADLLGVPLGAERWSENPFFARYYADPIRWALHTHLYFVTTSLEEYRALALGGIGGVHDRGPHEMDRVFGRELVAQSRLDSAAGELCSRLTEIALQDVAPPDLLILLECPIDDLLERARARGREGESLDRAYLTKLAERYAEFAAEWSICPVLRVDSASNDIRDPEVVRRVTGEVVGRLDVRRDHTVRPTEQQL